MEVQKKFIVGNINIAHHDLFSGERTRMDIMQLALIVFDSWDHIFMKGDSFIH